MIVSEKPSLDEALLIHFGILGMKWGQRKDRDESLRKAPPGLTVDSSLHRSSQNAAIEVADFMNKRYGFKITTVKSFAPGSDGYAHGHFANVEITPGRRDGVINSHPADLRPYLKRAERTGWSGKNCGTPVGLFTHESAHALLHADLQRMQIGGQAVRAWGGNSVAMDKAMQASLKEAQQNGIPPKNFTKALSGYAKKSNVQEEVEAELFTQYHLSPNPPSFVKVWGQTLHKEMGIDGTPMRDGATSHGK